MREDLSDLSEEDPPSRPAQLPKPVIRSFRVKNEADLFGLGLDKPVGRDSSEEGEEPRPQSDRGTRHCLADKAACHRGL